jgi:exopolyphosphatase / guanosine-5'-triphosphate,3'-diphosphate pyrophosphatase
VTRAGERLAAIDVGSNTILLTIADYDPVTGLTTIEEAEDQPRLGAGLRATGRLDERAMERAMASLVRMRDACRRLEVGRLDAVATAAVREARNGAEFVQRVRTLEIPLRIISPETEADLSYRSAAHHFPTTGPTLVADIGGGSLELIGARDGLIQLKQSLPLGAVRLTEMGLPLTELRRHIESELARAISKADWARATIIGSGGTFASLASMVLAARGALGMAVHETHVASSELQELLMVLAALTPEARRQTPGLRPERADIIVAGLAVVTELLRRTGSGLVTVSGFGLRDGLLLEMVAR